MIPPKVRARRISKAPTKLVLLTDWLFRGVAIAATGFILVLVLTIVATTAWGGREAMQAFGFGFLTSSSYRSNLTFSAIGINISDEESVGDAGERLQTRGLVLDLDPQGLLARSGLQSGDLLTSVSYTIDQERWSDVPIDGRRSLQKYLVTCPVGSLTRFHALRDGAEVVETISLIPNNGILPEIFGTIYTSLISLLVAGVLGVLVAIFLTENFLPRKIEFLVQNLVELLAAIPSVVFGLWGIFVLIPAMRSFLGLDNLTPSLLPAIVVLSIMLIPTVTALARDAMLAVPRKYRDAALGLGATKWEIILRVVLPTASSGIFGAMVLALGRALGETMALAMLAGNGSNISFNLLVPGNTLAAMIANRWSESTPGLAQSSLLLVATVLLTISLLVNVIGELIVKWATRHAGASQ